MPNVEETTSELADPDAQHMLADGRVVVVDSPPAIFVDDQPLHLTTIPDAILRCLAQRPDRYLALDQLAPGLTTNSLQTQIWRIREQLGVELGNPDSGAIRSASKLGYIGLSTMDVTRVAIPRPDETVYPIADGRIQINPQRRIVRVNDEWLE